MITFENQNGKTSNCFIIAVLVLAFSSDTIVTAADLGGRAGKMWAPFLEWELTNDSYSGNPFDVMASAIFIHAESAEKRVTQMFYDGNNTWKFRFTGTRVGAWSFTTSSEDPELSGHTGAVTIEPNPNDKIKGFLTHRGNKFAIQRSSTDDLEGYVFMVYMGRVNFPAYLEVYGPDLKDTAGKTRAYLAEAMENGFETIFLHVNNNWLKYGARTYSEHKSEEPDLTAFRVVETVIAAAHQAGGRVHIWAWGDEQRKWTPRGLPGGVNGSVDRRLQRYIAARLGPLPGWTMGYGFDLHEWTNGKQLNSWADFLHGHFGWQHLLSARGIILSGPDNINSYDGMGRNVALHTTSGGPKDYQEIVDDLDSNVSTPHLYEERHTYKRPRFQLDMDGTRRLMWWEAMAGGMGGFFGFYPPDSSAFAGHPYPNPEQLRTHYTFWHTNRRFLLDMERANHFSDDRTFILENSDNTRFILYKESSDTIQIDFSTMPGPQPAVAVDTKKAYSEIHLGDLQPKAQTIELPTVSDWVLAVGHFKQPTGSGGRGHPQ